MFLKSAKSQFLIVLFPVVAFLIGCSENSLPPLHVTVGQPFPEFQMKGLQGDIVSSRRFNGKALIINIWATWCSACRHELPSLQRLKNQLDPNKFVVFGITVDKDVHLVKEYLIDRKITFPNYLDKNMTISDGVLGVRLFPATFLVKSDGTLANVIEGWREWDNPELVAQIKSLNQKP